MNCHCIIPPKRCETEEKLGFVQKFWTGQKKLDFQKSDFEFCLMSKQFGPMYIVLDTQANSAQVMDITGPKNYRMIQN